MRTLKEMVEIQSISGQEDIEIIKDWFTENGNEIMGIKMMAYLSESKMAKIQSALNKSRAFAGCMCAKDIFKAYDADFAELLINFQDFVMAYMVNTETLEMDAEIPGHMLERLKDECPKHKRPIIYYRYALDLLDMKGIKWEND